jgi:hypothetical protein
LQTDALFVEEQGSLYMPAQRKRYRREDEPVVEIVQPSREENELSDFLDSLGPQGVTQVKLYRLMPTGKQVFMTGGPPSQFSEMYVQLTFGEGDYMVRSIVDGRSGPSKSFSVGPMPGGNTKANANGSHHHDSELEHLKLELNAQQLRIEHQQAQMEADRREREQRSHELQLKMFESLGGNRGNDTTNITAMIGGMIGGLKNLKDLSGTGEPMAAFNQYLEAFERINALKASNNGDGGSWWQPLVTEGARTLGDGLRAVAPFLPAIFAPKPNAITNAPSPIVQQPYLPPGQPVNLPNGQPAIAPPASTPTASEPAAGQPVQTPPIVAPAPQAENVVLAAAAPGVPTVDQFQNYKKQAIEFVMPFAVSGGNPDLYAELAVHEINRGDVGIARLFQELSESKDFDYWFDDLRQVEPAIVGQRTWFSAFYQAVKTIIAAGQNDEADHGEKTTETM